MNKQHIGFTETALRDASQSLIATRLSYDKMEPILDTMDKAGYYSCEVWGGATFDVCLRFLNEDPWERLRKIREHMPNTKLQMLLRGQNILGYKHYPDDIVRRFVRASVKNGIDIIRIFDALNDVENLKVAIEETVKCGAMASGTISYTTSPVHTLENYVKMVNEMAKILCVSPAELIGYQKQEIRIETLSDVLFVLNELNKKAGIRFDIDVKRPPHFDEWTCALRFNGNDSEAEHNADLCLFLERFANERLRLDTYWTDQEDFDRWFERQLAYYATASLPNKEVEIMTAEERLKRRIELDREMIEAKRYAAKDGDNQ